MLAAGSAAAARPEPRSPAAFYVEARAAAEAGAEERASAGFGAAMDAAPGDTLIASQALAHAAAAGDWPLALRAARLLDQVGELLPNARFLLLSEALRGGDWAEARAQMDKIEQEEIFAFTLPVLRAWVGLAAGDGDPVAILDAGATSRAAQTYAAEHRPLLLLASGKEGGAEALLSDSSGLGVRAQRLRLAAAAMLANRGERDRALALLQGEDELFTAARRLVEAGRPVPGAIDGPASAAAELYVRLVFDLQRENLAPMALMFARLATWLAPDSSETWLVASELLAAEERPGAALAMLDRVAGDDPFASIAQDQRIRLLARNSRTEAAIAEAEAAARTPGAGMTDWVRLGQLYSQAGRHGEAADAFGHALGARTESEPEWPLWLMRGSAWNDAGDWPKAEAALREAHRLAPDQPVVLNDLGYSLLERRENIEEGEALVREAHRLAPDSPFIADSLGWALYLKGEFPQAIELLEQAAQGEPADVEINEHLGDAYYKAGRRIEARFAWRAALVHAEDEDAERIRAKIDTGLTPRLAAR